MTSSFLAVGKRVRVIDGEKAFVDRCGLAVCVEHRKYYRVVFDEPVKIKDWVVEDALLFPKQVKVIHVPPKVVYKIRVTGTHKFTEHVNYFKSYVDKTRIKIDRTGLRPVIFKNRGAAIRFIQRLNWDHYKLTLEEVEVTTGE